MISSTTNTNRRKAEGKNAMTYTQIKEELKKRCSSTKYFTKEFYKAFLTARETKKEYIEKGIDDSYKKGYVTLYHSYDQIYESKFYNLNSGTYCEFLSLI